MQGCLAFAANGEGDVFLLGTLTVRMFQTTRTLSTLQTRGHARALVFHAMLRLPIAAQLYAIFILNMCECMNS